MRLFFFQVTDEVQSHVEKSSIRLLTLPKRKKGCLGFMFFENTTSLPPLYLLPGEVNEITEGWNILETFFLDHQTGLAYELHSAVQHTWRRRGWWDCTLPRPSPVLTRTKRSAWGVCMHAWLVGYQLEPLEGKERQKPIKPKRLLPRAAWTMALQFAAPDTESRFWQRLGQC